VSKQREVQGYTWETFRVEDREEALECHECYGLTDSGWYTGKWVLCHPCFDRCYLELLFEEEFGTTVKDDKAVTFLLWKLLNNVAYTEVRSHE
jgi:hypothetical protein